jgi:hypothetical protein
LICVTPDAITFFTERCLFYSLNLNIFVCICSTYSLYSCSYVFFFRSTLLYSVYSFLHISLFLFVYSTIKNYKKKEKRLLNILYFCNSIKCERVHQTIGISSSTIYLCISPSQYVCISPSACPCISSMTVLTIGSILFYHSVSLHICTILLMNVVWMILPLKIITSLHFCFVLSLFVSVGWQCVQLALSPWPSFVC